MDWSRCDLVKFGGRTWGREFAEVEVACPSISILNWQSADERVVEVAAAAHKEAVTQLPRTSPSIGGIACTIPLLSIYFSMMRLQEPACRLIILLTFTTYFLLYTALRSTGALTPINSLTAMEAAEWRSRILSQVNGFIMLMT